MPLRDIDPVVEISTMGLGEPTQIRDDALVGGVLAGVIGDTMLYVSGGAEHQGPPGGGPVAIIARV